MIPQEQLDKIYNQEWCKRHRKRPLRIVHMLQERELGTRRPGTHLLSGSYYFYQCFKLENTCSILSSNMTPIRFTPDGLKLVSFNSTLNKITVSWYNGVNAIRNPTIANLKAMFTKHFSSQIQGTLSRELCLITSDSKHMIIASVLQVLEQNTILSQIIRNNESVTTGFNLEHTNFISYDLNKGVICDSVRHGYDSIRMASSVYLVDRLLGVLSVQHQTIIIYKIDELSGCFSKVIEIGRSLYEDDDLYLNLIPSNPRVENVYLGFRHRFLSFLYRAHKRAGTSLDFMRSINHYLLLKMQKMQFLGPDIILIRLGVGVGTESSTRKEEDKMFCMFVLLDWRKSEILAVHNRFSETFFKLFVNFTETFINGSVTTNHFPTTMEHCQLLRQQQHDNIIDALVASSSPETALRVRSRTLNWLPCSGTGVPLFTPFLDPHMFSFDDRILNCIESGRVSANTELKIYCRKTYALTLHINFSKFTEQDSPFRLLFHPTDPLVLLTRHCCSDSPIYIFTPPLAVKPKRPLLFSNNPGPSSSISI